jgi:toxin ParE1/3/4
MKYELTGPAERDIRGILRDTIKMFGPLQAQVYSRIIERGIAMVAERPDRPGSLDRSEVAPGVRLLHLELAAGRRGAAAHHHYYMNGRLSDGSMGTIILRVLHEHMEPRYRIVRALRETRRKLPNQRIPEPSVQSDD